MKLDYKNYILGLLFCLPVFATAQVGINNTDPQAQLDITASNVATPSNTDGLLIPRVDAFPSTNPTATQQGMLVYLTTTVGLNVPGFYYWDNTTTTWKTISPALTEIDPQVSSATTNRIPKWNGTTLVDGQIFDNGTNVGIGTTSPTQKLDVNGNVRGVNIYATSYLQTGALLPNTVTPIAAFHTGGTKPVLIGDSGVNKGVLIGRSGNDIQGRMNANFTTNGDLLLNSLGGNVGVGTATPTEKLDVNGKTKTTNFQMTNGATTGYVLQSDATGNTSWVNPNTLTVAETDPQVASATLNYIPKWNGTTLVDGQVFDNGTNVSIGTTTAAGKFNVAVSSGEYMVPNWGVAGSETVLGVYSSNTADGAQLRFDSSASDFTDIGRDNSGNFVVQQNDSKKLVITPLGNVGIGTATPTEKLDVNGKTKTTNLQITNGATMGYVLQSDASGNGTWVNSNTLSIDESDPQVSSTTSNYLSKWNGTTLVDGQVFDNGTNIGIGTAIPTEKLEIIGKTKTTNIQITNGATTGYVLQSDAIGNGTWVNSSALSIAESDPQVSSAASNYMPKWNGTTLVDGQVFDNGTNVGIGTTSPSQKLDVNGNIRGANIYATSYLQLGTLLPNTVTPIAAFNTGGSMPVLIGDSSINKGILIGRNGNDIQGRAVANFTTNSDLLLNSLGGNVGIGTSAPTQAILVVNGSQNFTSAYGYLNGAGTTGVSGLSTNSYSIYASSRIAATEFNAFSDARIKNVLRRSNSKEDLATLSKIQITDYKHIDTIANSNKTIKKVIAQEIREVFPNAVSMHSDFIPNVYKLSEIKNGIITVGNDFKKGDKVKLVFTDGEKIVEVKNATAVNFEINSEKSGKVFVYGKQVNDFHTVDYEALSTLNISATQELLKRIENLEKQNKKLEEQVSEVYSLKMENLQLKAENKSIHEMQKDIELLKKTLLNDVSINNNMKIN